MRTLSVALLALSLLGCSDPEAAKSALLDEGFTNVEITGWEFGCSKDDTTCTGFRAIGPTGRHVTGVVGCGIMLKGCTVRITR